MSVVDWVMGVVLTALALLDWFFVTARIPPSSRRVASYSWRLSVAPFTGGVVVGRGFAPNLGPPEEQLHWMVLAFVGVSVAVVVFHWAVRKGLEVPNGFSLIYVPIGMLLGMLLWPVAAAGGAP